jgi:hypothetical protein
MQVGDFYLEALLDEIKGLRADLEVARNPVVVDSIAITGSLPEPPPTPPKEQDPGEFITEGSAKGLLQRIMGR